MVIDPDLVKSVLQKDFQHFVNHANYINEENDPLGIHLFNLKDEAWRNLRTKLTPTFTSGKIKMMFQTLADCTPGLKELITNEAINKSAPVEIKEMLARFTTDIICSTAFGLECNSLKNPDTPFRKYGRRIFEMHLIDHLKIVAQFLVPHGILRALRMKTTKSDVEEFFTKVFTDNMEYREKNNIYRKDFMHLLLQLKNRGFVADDGKIVENGKVAEKGLSLKEITAQAFVFIAGFETSSTLMTFALFELSQNQEVQDKLREEIVAVLKKHNNEITYEAIMEMTYLDQVLQESLRLHPPVPFLMRSTSKDYQVPNSSLVVKKGVTVLISNLGIHRDPEFYPNPDKFNPENFSEENKHSRPGFTFLPFGEGPRICIGLRFGMLQSKVGLTALLRNFKFTLNNKTALPLKMDTKSIVRSAEGGVWLNAEKVI